MKRSWVYIMANKNKTTLYTGVTSRLSQRVIEHKTKKYKGFSARYNCENLVFFREFTDIKQAIQYEKN
ncbi:GIY-YIG nuclease family protein [Antarcticibacterium sp. 1MA-6-2]|uniref:GIY-YIG nuclease family protein n=1 Tax=Antarcticibacterium sp. 1MA-6-2 TaxID=2908210 RepID=UPI0028832E91|nr:GIY-YIG nuclease family protein [Antarcticibacterium sp. 1MA-6-2]